MVEEIKILIALFSNMSRFSSHGWLDWSLLIKLKDTQTKKECCSFSSLEMLFFFFCKMEKKDTKKAWDYLGGNIKAKDAGLL